MTNRFRAVVTAWVLAAAGVAGLSAAAWTGTARPWDGELELWRWTAWLAIAGAVLGLLTLLGTASLRQAAASAGAVLLVAGLVMWLRQWWLLDFPAGEAVGFTAPISHLPSRVPSGHPTAVGFVAAALLLVAVVLSVATVFGMARRQDQSPAG